MSHIAPIQPVYRVSDDPKRYRGKWTICLLTKQGRIFTDGETYATKEQAQQECDELHDTLKRGLDSEFETFRFFDDNRTWSVMFDDTLMFMPMPMKGD